MLVWREKKPAIIKKCIKSWKKYCPDYQIIEWNESNFDVNCNQFCKSAYKNKKWAFVSDYARLKVLYDYGGFYMDTNVELVKPLDDFRKLECFLGFQHESYVNNGLVTGAVANHFFIKENMMIYESMDFKNETDSTKLTVCQEYTTSLLKKRGLKVPGDNQIQMIDNIVIFPPEYFCPYDHRNFTIYKKENTVAIHHFASSWWDDKRKREYRKIKQQQKIHYCIHLPNMLIKNILGDERYEKLKFKNKGEIKMKIIGMIPARGGSTRFNNKPLAKICDKPMVYWVWKHSKEVECFDEVYVATDSEEIKQTVESFGGKVIMTSTDCETATERLYEVSKKIAADLYVMVNGDEPLIMAEDIVKCIPDKIPEDGFYVSNLMTDFSNPVEVVDPTNLKIVTNKDGICLFISRAPIPFPKGEMNYVYQKFVGVGAFTNKALEYYHNTPRGPIEKIEENDSFRFIENRKDCYYINAHCKTLSVDTPKDRVQVERYMKENNLDK